MSNNLEFIASVYGEYGAMMFGFIAKRADLEKSIFITKDILLKILEEDPALLTILTDFIVQKFMEKRIVYLLHNDDDFLESCVNKIVDIDGDINIPNDSAEKIQFVISELRSKDMMNVSIFQ